MRLQFREALDLHEAVVAGLVADLREACGGLVEGGPAPSLDQFDRHALLAEEPSRGRAGGLVRGQFALGQVPADGCPSDLRWERDQLKSILARFLQQGCPAAVQDAAARVLDEHEVVGKRGAQVDRGPGSTSVEPPRQVVA